MSDQAFNDWKLVSLSPLPTWALALLGLGILFGVFFAAFGVRKEPLRWRRYLLWVLRLGAGVAALFFLLEPGLRRLQVATVKNRLAVLVDRSASMGFPAEVGGPSRAVQVADYLDSVKRDLERLGERFVVEVYGFDPELSQLSPQALRHTPPRGGKTDLLSALLALKGGESGDVSKQLSGVLLFSDGADNTELASGVVGQPKRLLSELGFPVSTFAVGTSALKDLSVEEVRMDDFAFVRNAVTVEVEIHGRGFAKTEVPVILSREGSTVATKTVHFSTDDEGHKVSFSFTPDQTGRFVYTVGMPAFPGEVVAENNTRAFVLKVIRDRIRVLLVVGRPSWDERFLRGLLKQDPNVDLVSFYILRTLSDDPNVMAQDRELSLIPFPTDEIFDLKLHTFDVVVFQNFGYSEQGLSISNYERKLEQYVKNGGALLMIGGDRSFGEGRTSFPVLQEALPVENAGPANLDSFKPRVTPEGLRHPVTALASAAGGTEATWASLPPLAGANLVRAKAGATVLLEHPFLTTPGSARNAPILALWDYGRGRSMALMVDSSWFWALPAHAQGAPGRDYDRFYGNVLRWLVRDPELTTVLVQPDPQEVEPGKPVGAVVSARQSDYQPAVGAQVTVELWDVNAQKKVSTLSATAGKDGVARVEFPPPAPGPYKLKAQATLAGKMLGESEDVVAVRAVGKELSDASVRPQLLEAIANVTGGKAFALPRSGLPELPLKEPPRVEVGRGRDQPLWDRWDALLVLVALLGAEWLLRRRFGYV